ncbi:hypothetical protein [Myceligenerans xiligouense]|uniref:Uncharacterized protein n=1 Tax=Myceligenerans xiligouense TaxID=253184 RepID=A0A3N4YS44_9MICO|nr:hypothetical protein [Myceligenerans xiligouense]RPF22204.1 hypothetical protein EDD34_2852 [Myceligenerans xiligouense]
MSDGSQTVREPGAEQDVAEPAEGAQQPAAGAEETAGVGAATAERAPAEDGAPGAEPSGERASGGLESLAAERLHALVERGAEKIPGDQGGVVSRFAVALLSFGSAVTERGEKQTSTLATDAVQVFKSLDDDPATQRAAMEKAISDIGSNLVRPEDRGKVLDVAQQAMGLWRSARGTGSDLAKSDSALSLRSLAGLLRNGGDEDGAAQSEDEARKLEGK